MHAQWSKLYVGWFWDVVHIEHVRFVAIVNNGPMCDTGRMLLLYSDGWHVEGVVLCLLLYNYNIFIVYIMMYLIKYIPTCVALYRAGQS